MRYIYRNRVDMGHNWRVEVIYPSLIERDEHYSTLTYLGVECKPLSEVSVSEEEFNNVFGERP